MRKKYNQIGRSMVEMLGVLAIIGVLSVGGITGYSKAMQKYKLNKHAQSINLLINNIIAITPSFKNSYTGTPITEKLLYQLNLIPTDMQYETEILKDIFDNSLKYMYAYSRNIDGTGQMEHNLYMTLSMSADTVTTKSAAACHSIINVAKSNSANIKSIQLRSSTDNNLHNLAEIFYGHNYCSTGRKCIKNLTNTDIENMCYNCTSKISCTLYIFFPTS